MYKKIEDILIRRVIDEWTLKGHSLSGEFESSLQLRVEHNNLELWGNEYGIYMNEGVPASNIPYTRRKRGQGKGGTSKYLTGLINYVKKRMGIGDQKEATSIAFAIAEKHKVNGILGSGFLDEAIEKSEAEIDKEMERIHFEELKKEM